MQPTGKKKDIHCKQKCTGEEQGEVETHQWQGTADLQHSQRRHFSAVLIALVLLYKN